jgi:hypothetical protein
VEVLARPEPLLHPLQAGVDFMKPFGQI